MVNDVGFMMSEEEDLALGPETRLDHSGLLVAEVYLHWKETEKASDTDIRLEESDPVLAKELYTF